MPNDFPLLLRLVNAREGLEEALARIYYSERDAKMLAERLLHLLAFVQAHEAVINELETRSAVIDLETNPGACTYNSMEAVSNRLRHQFCSHRGIDSTLG